MSKKTRYFIEPLPEGKVRTWIIKSNKNNKFLTEYPNAKEVTRLQHEAATKALKKATQKTVSS